MPNLVPRWVTVPIELQFYNCYGNLYKGQVERLNHCYPCYTLQLTQYTPSCDMTIYCMIDKLQEKTVLL